MPYTAPEQVIEDLRLTPHPEGGHYREVHRSAAWVGEPSGFFGPRVALTAIYFLLQAGEFSAFHRVRSEEAWVYLAGAPLQLVLLGDKAELVEIMPAGTGGVPMHVVPPCRWQAARSVGEWSLVTCLVAPGFEFADFELPEQGDLLAEFPQHRGWISRFTR